MNKSVLALSTALSIFMFTPAFAQNSNTNNAGTNCAEQNSGTGSTTATDPNCVTKNNATESSAQPAAGADQTQQQTQSGSTTAPATGDQNASGSTGTSSDTTNQNAQSGTGTGATATDQKANSGSSTTMDQNQNAQSGTSTTTDQNAASNNSTMSTGTSNMSTDLIVPADRLNGAKLMSANDYIGKTVYDQTGANIGEVNDLIMSGTGDIQAVILGVGGFLGIGEKNVAVAVPAVQMVQDGNSMRLVVQSTKEQLEAAPSYDVRNRRYATDDNGTMNNNTDATGTTTTAPATAPATGTDGTMNNTTGTGTTNSDGSSN